jgi:hypothetical protein
MKLKNILPLIAISILGIASMVVPVYLLGDSITQYDAPLFPLLRTAIERPSPYFLPFLFLSAFVVKLFSDVSSWKIGLMSMALLPLAAICEMIVDSSSHNLFPIEFLFYDFYTIPAIIGAYIAQLIKSVDKPILMHFKK